MMVRFRVHFHVLGVTIMVFFQIPRYHSLHKKMKFCIKNLFSKRDQIRRKLRIWSHLLKKSLLENFIFCTVITILMSLLLKVRKMITTVTWNSN